MPRVLHEKKPLWFCLIYFCGIYSDVHKYVVTCGIFLMATNMEYFNIRESGSARGSCPLMPGLPI